jgi:hypothetical protein
MCAGAVTHGKPVSSSSRAGIVLLAPYGIVAAV